MLNLCLIGKDIKNSRSPELYLNMAKTDNVDLKYELCDLCETELDEFILSDRENKYDGFNVTHPYKKIIMNYLDYISDEAVAVEAVNTVRNVNGKLYGYNTDIYGAYESIKPVLCEGSILILGRGGAARAVVYAFKDYDLTIYARDLNNEEILKIKSDLKVIDRLENVDFVNVINATSVGFNSDQTILEKPFKSQKTAVDLIYTPPKTKFLKNMEKYNIKTKNGYDMLRLQAEKSYKIYLGDIV